jgi:phage terminase small subunit
MNDRHRLFVKEYLVDLNGARAAIRAGYAQRQAKTIGSRLLRRPEIAALVAKGKEQRADKKRVTADRVIEELGRMAFADIRNFIDWGPQGVKLRNKSALDGDDAAAIADVEAKGSNGQIGRLKLYDKLAALNALARHLGMIGGRAALGPQDHTTERRDANAILRERLLRIAKAGEGK